jgi:hypothetical protein
METFVVRIYRRTEGGGIGFHAALVGLVEPVGGGRPRAFRSALQLWSILMRDAVTHEHVEESAPAHECD